MSAGVRDGGSAPLGGDSGCDGDVLLGVRESGWDAPAVCAGLTRQPAGTVRRICGRFAVLAGVALVVVTVFLGLPLCSSVPDGDSEEQESQQAAPAAIAPDTDTTEPAVTGGAMPTSFEVDGATGELVGYAAGPLGVRATWSVASSLEEVCAAVLTGYESQGDVALHYSGYLDLLGNTWACLVAGPSWVEVAVVEDGGAQGDAVGAHSQEGPCELSVMRLGQQAIEEGQEQDVGEVGG